MEVFTYLILILSIIIGFFLLSKIVEEIHFKGFNCISTFIFVSILFYLIIPLLYIKFEENRDSSTAFNILLKENSNIDIATTILMCILLIAAIWIFYKIDIYNSRKVIIKLKEYKKDHIMVDWENVNKICYKRISIVADITLILGAVAIIGCIVAVGGIGKYLALGSQARGLNKDITDYVSSAFLPLITLSTIVLVAPYLYKYLIENNKGNFLLKVKFVISFIICVIYLLYNQGRLPLLLFFIPFILESKIARNMKIGTLIVVTVLCIFVLEPLSNLFTYLSYGRIVQTNSSSFMNTLLLEFTYPFSNFINKSKLVLNFGFRYGLDYIQWPFTVIPSSLLKIIGISKNELTTIGALNTDAYATIVGRVGGGIPADFFTFNYYQFGIFSLLLSVFIVARILKKIDQRIEFIRPNKSTMIIILRVCFLLISLVNNFDFSVIFRMRFDLLIHIGIIFYIASKGKEVMKIKNGVN